MKRELLLQMVSGLAVTGLVAYKLATVPIAGTDTAPISAGAAAGFPWKAGAAVAAQQYAVATADEARDAMLLEKAFAAQTMALLGVRVLDLSTRGSDTTENVQLSADAVDSTILQPNEVFSFNEIVGIRTSDRGYQAGLMYSNGQLITGVGGGICITSTLLYNVALETGMKIIERHPHSGPVSYAEPGRDSAVAYGSLDLQFVNNTGGSVLIRSILQDGKLVVAFYGRKQPGRVIDVVTEDFEPIPFTVEEKEDETVPEGESKVDQKGHPGFSVTTVRVIKQDGKVVSRELISRDFVRPRNEIVLVRRKAQSGSESVEQTPGLMPMPMYTPKYDMPDVQLALPDPGAQSTTESPLPQPDAETSGDEDAEKPE